ncbi:MAG TPA: SpoIIE family protein phosphatase [candidate division Zixibacteria bacterium]|nr:SpoIIE family protein phosphatase [candidate division Zixibacteria bacterium]
MSETSHHHQTRVEKLLLEAARTFNSTLEYEELVERVLRLVIAAADCEAALLFRVDHDRTDMKVRLMHCVDCKIRVFRREFGSGLLGWMTHYREPVIINEAARDERVDHELGRLGEIELRQVMSVPLIGKGQMIGVIEAINKSDGGFDDADLDVLIGLANQIAVALDNAHLYRLARREALEKRLLNDIGIKLSSPLRLDEVLQEILSSLKEAVSYDAGGVYLINSEKGDIQSLYTVGYDPALDAKVRLKVGQGLVGYVAKSGETINVPDVTADDRYVTARPETRSEMAVPIILDDLVIGVINLESNEMHAFQGSDRSLLSAFANHAAISIERARLHEEIISAKKLEEQLNIAREIQQTFLPDGTPSIAGYDIAGQNIPSFQVGGDYYDFIRIVESQYGIAIADVAGKGIPAALIMASFRASLIAEIRNNYSIRTICRKVNRLLTESLQPGRFVTAVYGVLDAKNHVLTFANCGHNLPILLRVDGSVEYLREGGPVMGVTAEAEYEERPLYIHAGEVLLFYTDGVSEVFNDKGEEFGLDRLIEVVRSNRDRSSREILGAVYNAVKAWAASSHVFDDLTMIAVKRIQ